MQGCELLSRGGKAWLAVSVIGLTAGCAKDRVGVPNDLQVTSPVPQRPPEDEIRERSRRSFARAVFYKPREESLVGIESTFAPLIVEEIGTDDECAADDPFGSIELTPYTPTRKEPRWTRSHPTVYFAEGIVDLHGERFQHLVYLWWYAARHTCPGGKHGLGRGVRVVVDPSGYPILWEALEAYHGENAPDRVVFVSADLERRAREHFGEPLPGRRYSIEGPKILGRNVVVAGLIDDAATPMGPYVYLNKGQRYITTIHCRCMPSQFENVAETREYRFQPLEVLAGFWEPPTLRPGSCFLLLEAGWGDDVLDILTTASPVQELDGLLRWPGNAR